MSLAICRQTVLWTIFLLGSADIAAAVEPPVTAIAFTAKGDQLVVGSQAGLGVLHWPDLTLARELPSRMPNIHDVALSHDGRRLAVAGGAPGESGSVEIFSWPGAASLARYVLHADIIYGMDWSADDARIATASMDGTACIVFAATGKPDHVLHGHSRGVTSIRFLADGEHILSASADHSLRLWQTPSGDPVRMLDNHLRAVHVIAVKPAVEGDRPMVATAAEDRTVRLWQPTIGRLVRFIRLPSVPLCLDWSADATRLLAGCQDGMLRVIDPDTVEVIHEQKAVDGWVTCVAIHPAGRVAVLAGQAGQITKLDLPE